MAAATYLDITLLPKNSIAGFPHRVRVTARDGLAAVDTGFVGTVHFTTNDLSAELPADYTFTGPDAGVRDFHLSFNEIGLWTLTVASPVISPTLFGIGRTVTAVRPPGWGFDDEGLLPYGDSAVAIGTSIRKAIAYSTREVDVTVSNLAQDNSPFLVGDALNPATWVVQRLDNLAFLHPVSVEQVGTYTYRVLCLEEFGPVSIIHRVSSSTLRDEGGNLLVSPTKADFLGLLEDTKLNFESQLAHQKVAARDIANAQLPGFAVFAGTLQLGGNGDYKTVTGTELTKKLILRRLITKPGDFFHLPNYGIGLREKEALPTSDLPKLKKAIEQQILREPEVQAVRVTLTLDPGRGILYVQVRAEEKKTGQQIEVGLKVNETGVVL